MNTTHLKDLWLSTEMMDANQISSYTETDFIHKNGIQDIGNIQLGTGKTTFTSADYIELSVHAAESGSNAKHIFQELSNTLQTALTSDISGENSIAAGGFALGKSAIAIGYHPRTGKYADRPFAIGNGAIALGNIAKANGRAAVSLGSSTALADYSFAACGGKAIGEDSFAIGGNTEGNYSFAHGYNSHSIGTGSNTFGNATSAVGDWSLAQGRLNLAQGIESHAEGWQTSAVGQCSHAEGQETIAVGLYSHAEGIRAVTTNRGDFTWNGDPDKIYCLSAQVKGVSGGTFGINPRGGIQNFYVGQNNVVSSFIEFLGSRDGAQMKAALKEVLGI